jgi:pimeloyl-ACP methyl ester carboxylesterase
LKVGLGYGLWCSRATLYFLRDKLVEAGFEPVWLDLDRDIGLTISDYLDQVERKVIQQKISLVIGHGMAGILCARVCDKHPELIKKMVLLAPAAPRGVFPIRNLYQIREIIFNIWQFLKTLSWPSRKSFERLSFNSHQKLGLDWDYLEMIVPEPNTIVFSLIFTGIFLSYVTCPTYFITGTRDRVMPYAVSYRMLKKHFRSINNTFSLAPGHDHFSILKNEGIARNIIDFLKT